MTRALATVLLGFTALASTAYFSEARAQSSGSATLDAVKARGQLVCGVAGGVPGFSLVDSQGKMTGLDADSCRAIAAATLGDADKALVGLLRAIEEGTRSEAIHACLQESEMREAAIQAKLNVLSQNAPAFTLHSNVAELEEALNDPAERLAAINILRGLIDHIVLTPG